MFVPFHRLPNTGSWLQDGERCHTGALQKISLYSQVSKWYYGKFLMSSASCLLYLSWHETRLPSVKLEEFIHQVSKEIFFASLPLDSSSVWLLHYCAARQCRIQDGHFYRVIIQHEVYDNIDWFDGKSSSETTLATVVRRDAGNSTYNVLLSYRQISTTPFLNTFNFGQTLIKPN